MSRSVVWIAWVWMCLAPVLVARDELPATGRADPRLTSFDQMMREFLREHDVPGASLAVSRDGRLVYSRGFGEMDRDTHELVQPDALFRIASISKPVTSAAIFQLVEAGRIALDDPVLEHLDPALLRGKLPKDSRWADITIRRLLQHAGGFDRELSGDPMFQARKIAEAFETPPPADARQVVSYMFTQPLDFTPGERMAYSNFGYCLLGRVIERITGKSYGDAVQEQLLLPLGIRSMHVGRTFEADRYPGEVHYHARRKGLSVFAGSLEERVPAPYGSWYHESLDSHGGWVASAPDLLRFAHLFGESGRRELLSKESIDEMFAEPSVSGQELGDLAVWYACGWSVRRVSEDGRSTWHQGYLPGSESLLVRRNDGIAWAVLFNSNADVQLSAEIDPLINEAAKLVQVWPDFDLYELNSKRAADSTGVGEAK